MTLESANLELVQSLKTIRESTADLLRLITEDRPYEHSLAYRFEHSTSDLLGRLDAALIASIALQQIHVQRDRVQVLDALVSCQTEINEAAEKLYNELKSYDWLQDLFVLGNEHPKEWLGWVTSIKATLDQCNLSVVEHALLNCWQNVSVALGATIP